MSARRAARAGQKTANAEALLPSDLAMGPCIEVWASEAKRAWQMDHSTWAEHRARRAWGDAMRAWADAVGMDKPFNAPNLARTRVPWSRAHLESQGRAALADYYEHGGTHPYLDTPNDRSTP